MAEMTAKEFHRLRNELYARFPLDAKAYEDEYDALAARLADADRQRNDEATHNFSLRMEVADLKARLAELERLAHAVCDVCSGGVIDDLRACLRKADSADEVQK